MMMSLSCNRLVPYYLMSSYLYYELDEITPITDSEYDILCKRLYDEWENITHVHKGLVRKDALLAGSGFYLSGRYPLIVQSAAIQWLGSSPPG